VENENEETRMHSSKYKLFSVTHKVLTSHHSLIASIPQWLNLCSIPSLDTRSLTVVTFLRPSVNSPHLLKSQIVLFVNLSFPRTLHTIESWYLLNCLSRTVRHCSDFLWSSFLYSLIV